MNRNVVFKSLCWLVVVAFGCEGIDPQAAGAQAFIAKPSLSAAGELLPLNATYTPVMIRGMKFNPADGLSMSFIVDTGDANPDEAALKQESEKLIKYFLASLAIPETDLWVNLSPYEKDRITSDALSHTEMGTELLAQDYILKKITSALIDPNNETGRKFWDKVYESIYKKLSSPNVSIGDPSSKQNGFPTKAFGNDSFENVIESFHKVWIMPDTAEVFAQGNAVLILNSRLKVMLEEDYLAKQQSQATSSVETGLKPVSTTVFENGNVKQIMREIVVPLIEEEVNSGENFAPLRQIFHALILAKWFKENLKESLLGKVYVNRSKIFGIDTDGKPAINAIYNRYVEAFNAGAEGLIKEEYDPVTQDIVAKKYMTGGFTLGQEGVLVANAMLTSDRAALAVSVAGKLRLVGSGFGLKMANGAMMVPGRGLKFVRNVVLVTLLSVFWQMVDAQIMVQAGMELGSSEINVPDSLKARMILDYERLTEAVRQGMESAEFVANPYRGPQGTSVNQNFYAIAPWDEPLFTYGAGPCSILLAIDFKNQKHYLAHIQLGTNPEFIIMSLRSMNSDSTQFYVIPGSDTELSSTPQVIFYALEQLGVDGQIKFLEAFDSDLGSSEIVSHQGRFFSGARPSLDKHNFPNLSDDFIFGSFSQNSMAIKDITFFKNDADGKSKVYVIMDANGARYQFLSFNRKFEATAMPKPPRADGLFEMDGFLYNQEQHERLIAAAFRTRFMEVPLQDLRELNDILKADSIAYEYFDRVTDLSKILRYRTAKENPAMMAARSFDAKRLAATVIFSLVIAAAFAQIAKEEDFTVYKYGLFRSDIFTLDGLWMDRTTLAGDTTFLEELEIESREGHRTVFIGVDHGLRVMNNRFLLILRTMTRSPLGDSSHFAFLTKYFEKFDGKTLAYIDTTRQRIMLELGQMDQPVIYLEANEKMGKKYERIMSKIYAYLKKNQRTLNLTDRQIFYLITLASDLSLAIHLTEDIPIVYAEEGVKRKWTNSYIKAIVKIRRKVLKDQGDGLVVNDYGYFSFLEEKMMAALEAGVFPKQELMDTIVSLEKILMEDIDVSDSKKIVRLIRLLRDYTVAHERYFNLELSSNSNRTRNAFKVIMATKRNGVSVVGKAHLNGYLGHVKQYSNNNFKVIPVARSNLKSNRAMMSFDQQAAIEALNKAQERVTKAGETIAQLDKDIERLGRKVSLGRANFPEKTAWTLKKGQLTLLEEVRLPLWKAAVKKAQERVNKSFNAAMMTPNHFEEDTVLEEDFAKGGIDLSTSEMEFKSAGQMDHAILSDLSGINPDDIIGIVPLNIVIRPVSSIQNFLE